MYLTVCETKTYFPHTNTFYSGYTKKQTDLDFRFEKKYFIIIQMGLLLFPSEASEGILDIRLVQRCITVGVQHYNVPTAVHHG